MNRRFAVVTLALLALLALGTLLATSPWKQTDSGLTADSGPTPPDSVRIVDVDEIAQHPSQFQGKLGVTGTVALVDGEQSAFMLGCADACVRVPVKYTGDMPAAQSDVTVYGEIQEADEGRYILVAQDVKPR